VFPDNELFHPIQVGAVNAKSRFEDMLHDDEGENISDKNKMYCELTAQYWAWKNDEADYYGFCHYRRYFSFSSKRLVEDVHGAVNFDCLDNQAIKTMCLDRNEVIQAAIVPYDFLIGSPAKLSKVNKKNLYEQYASAPDLHVEDLKCTINVLKELFPEYTDSADKYMNSNLIYPCNMFIMSKALFHEYCEWLFAILAETEKRIDMSNYSVEGLRTPGHLAERLLGIFYTYIRKCCPQYKTNILQRTIVWNTDDASLPKPYFEELNIPIVFACSDFFVPYFATTLQSLLEHTSQEHNYDIILLHTHITTYNQALLKKMVDERSNVSLRFINIASIVSSNKLVANNHVSVETFYRLMVDSIFLYYDKIVYLDSDLVILRQTCWRQLLMPIMLGSIVVLFRG